MAVRRKDSRGRVLPEGVTERADGRYIYRCTINGKAKYIYDKDLDSLKKKIAELKYNITKGDMNVVQERITLNDYFTQYLRIYKLDRVKRSTYANYENYYKWYISKSYFAGMTMRNINKSMMVEYINMDLVKKRKLSMSMCKHVAFILGMVFKQAYEDGIIDRNPALGLVECIVCDKVKEERDALSVEEVEKLLEFLKIEGTWQNVYLPCIAIGLATGMRFGELFGLTWSDVDLKNKVIDVNHSLSYRDVGDGHEWFISTPKTESGKRKIKMTDTVVELFRKQKKYIRDNHIYEGVEISGYKAFIFVTSKGTPFTHESIVRALKLIVKRCNEWEEKNAEAENREPVLVPVHTPHCWRHTFVTRCAENNIPPERTRVIVGHKKISTTLEIYTHLTGVSYDEAEDDMNKVFKL